MILNVKQSVQVGFLLASFAAWVLYVYVPSVNITYGSILPNHSVSYLSYAHVGFTTNCPWFIIMVFFLFNNNFVKLIDLINLKIIMSYHENGIQYEFYI